LSSPSFNNNNLIICPLKVLKAVMEATSHDQYFSFLNKLLDDPKKNTRLAKQFERVLIAIMDAFHFDLKLACPEEIRIEKLNTGAQQIQSNKGIQIILGFYYFSGIRFSDIIAHQLS